MIDSVTQPWFFSGERNESISGRSRTLSEPSHLSWPGTTKSRLLGLCPDRVRPSPERVRDGFGYAWIGFGTGSEPFLIWVWPSPIWALPNPIWAWPKPFWLGPKPHWLGRTVFGFLKSSKNAPGRWRSKITIFDIEVCLNIACLGLGSFDFLRPAVRASRAIGPMGPSGPGQLERLRLQTLSVQFSSVQRYAREGYK